MNKHNIGWKQINTPKHKSQAIYYFALVVTLGLLIEVLSVTF